jgi:hypothetical protein
LREWRGMKPGVVYQSYAPPLVKVSRRSRRRRRGALRASMRPIEHDGLWWTFSPVADIEPTTNYYDRALAEYQKMKAAEAA